MDHTKCPDCLTLNSPKLRFCSSCGQELPSRGNAGEKASIEKPDKKPFMSYKAMIGTAVGIGVMITVRQVFFGPPALDKTLMKIAGEVNKVCPMMVDSVTRLDNATALPGNVFQYNYTLLHVTKGDLDTTEAKNYMAPSMASLVRTSPQMKFQREHQTQINYSYKDLSGNYLFTIPVTPSQYK